MQNGLSAIEAQRNQLLQARLDQLQEILSVKKERLKELYQLYKFRYSLGDLLHASTTDDNLAPGEDDAGCNAFVELYEHGGISDFTDWPLAGESSSMTLPREPELSPPPSERVSAVSPPAPTEPLVPSASISPPIALSSPTPLSPPPPPHLSPPSRRSPLPHPSAQSPPPHPPSHTPPAAPTISHLSPLPPHSPARSSAHSPARSPPRSPHLTRPSPPSPSLPLPSPPHSPPSVSPLPPSSPLPPPSPSPSPSPSLSPSPSRSPSTRPVSELPYDETQDVDPFSDLASEAAPRQEVLIPPSPEPSPEAQVPVNDHPVEEETLEPKMVEAQPLPETIAADETLIQQTAVSSLPPSPDVMQEVVMEEKEDVIEDEYEPTVIVQSVPDNVRSSPAHEALQPSPPMVPSEMPSPEESEAIAIKSDGDEDEEKAVSQSVVAEPEPEPDLRESPDRDLETHVASRVASPEEEVVAAEPLASPAAAEEMAEAVEEAVAIPSETVDQPDQEVKMDIDHPEQEAAIENDADLKTDVTVEKGIFDIEEVKQDVREEEVPVPLEVSEIPAQEEVAKEDQPVQEETGQEDQRGPVVEETVSDKEPTPTPSPPPEAQEADNVRPTNAVQVFDDYVEEGIPSPIEDARLPLLRPMGPIPTPEEFDSPTRSPSGSLTRSPSIVPELPSSQVGSHIGIEDGVPPVEEKREIQETQETQEAKETQETQEGQETQENVYIGRVTRSRSRMLTDSPALKTQRLPTKSPSLKDEFRRAELEQPDVEAEAEVEIEEVADEVVTTQDIDEGREASVVSKVQDATVSQQVSDEQREASVVSQAQDTAISRQATEQPDIDHPQSTEESVSPAAVEPLAVSPESDVEMEDVDVPQDNQEEEPSPVSIQESRDDLADQTDIKMEGDQTPLDAISPNLLLRFPPVSPRPSQNRTLLLDAVPSTIPGIRSILFDSSVSAERDDEDGKDDVQAMDAQTLPDTTLPPMPTSPMLTPYVDSISLPRTEELPATLARKVHPAKLARKRDREREREKDAKEDNKDKKDLTKGAWLPWEVSRWGAHIRANAAHKMVRRTGKVLTTKMWNVAHSELKLSRTLEQIERLKQEGRWSFRQPKKQKGPLVSKSHWDWMLDEMKWMSTDFREERIWKTTVAFNIAQDVRLWHLATPEERKMLCVPRSAVQRGIHDLSMNVEPAEVRPPAEQHVVDKPLGTVELPDVEDAINQTSEELWQTTEELDPEKEASLILRRQREQRNEEEAKNLGEQDSLDADGEDDADGEMDVDVEEEEVEPVLDLTAPPVDAKEENQPTQVPESSQEIAVETPLSTEIGLKNVSADLSAGPVLSSAPEKLPGTTVTDTFKNHVRTSLLNIADDEPFLDIDELCSGLSQMSTLDDHASLDLPELFSDYQIYQPLFPSPELAETAVLPRTDKKAEKKERKVIEELTRVDEATLSKVVNVSTFMQYRPLLVSALQPAKRYRDGKWINLEDTVVSSEDTAAVAGAEPPPDHLFGPQRTRPSGFSLFGLGTRMPKDGQKRVNETPWSNSEDLLLKDIAERYPNNWGLIADMFNSSRVTISNDQRTGWDCMVRWDLRWNDGKLLTPPAVPTTPEVSISDIPNVSNPAQTPVHGQAMLNALMTRKRSVGQLSLTLPSQPAESRKRRRHNHMHEAMKKSAKKRETSMKQIIPNRRPNSQVHETHNAFKQPTHRTPAELSRLKAEKDRREFEEQQLRRKQQEEEIIRKRQMELRQQQQIQSAQPVAIPHVRGPNHPQVNISQQAARLPNAAVAAGNVPVPTVPQNPQIPAGVNLNTPSLPRFTPEQHRVVYMQMQQARQLAQAQAQAQLQQAQAQAQRSPVQQQAQQSGQPSQQQPQAQSQPLPQSQPQQQPQPQQLHPQPQQQVQPQQQHQQQPNMSALGNTVPNAAQHVMPGTPVIPPHPAMHPHSSPIPAQATIHHSAVPQITPPRLGTPGNINLMGMNAGSSVVRPNVPQIAQQQRPGSTPQIPSVPSQPPRPTSTQLPQQAGQMMRQTALQQHQHHQQQQQAMHHASMQNMNMQNMQNMQNMHNSGLTQEQMKRLYHSQLYWGNPQAMHAVNAQMAYTQSPQHQPQTPQQQISSPRPPSVQPHSNITPSPAPPS